MSDHNETTDRSAWTIEDRLLYLERLAEATKDTVAILIWAQSGARESSRPQPTFGQGSRLRGEDT